MFRNRSHQFLRRAGVLVGLCFLPSFWGCATAIHGTTQAVVVNSRPPGARVIVDDSREGTTPCSFQLERKSDHSVVIEMSGYAREEFQVVRVPTGKVVNNLWLGGLIGLAVDASTGADNKLVPEQIDVTLRAMREEPGGEVLSAAPVR